tara:strand:+ start:1681 stop:1941 length:261 start_codon:yes stop_codon:yes gene_type:complete
MRTLTYNPESQKWIESDDGLDPEVPSNDWYLKVLRKKRNSLLKETDWMANSDVTMTDAWKNYRQALRDLPANTADPKNPTYPTKPS